MCRTEILFFHEHQNTMYPTRIIYTIVLIIFRARLLLLFLLVRAIRRVAGWVAGRMG